MRTSSDHRMGLAVAAVAAPLLWSNWALPALDLGIRGRTLANVGFASGYSLAIRRLDRTLAPPRWITKRGLIVGATAATVPLVGLAVAAMIPAARTAFGQRSSERNSAAMFAEWVLIHIPVGTVYSEELTFRGTLNPLLENSFGPRGGLGIGAVAFGLWHIHPARSAGERVSGTVVATTLAGLLLGWLGNRSGSVSTPALVHLSANVGGAVVDRMVGGK